MSITCQLCNMSFTKFISGKHLKHKHNTTSAEYKSQFGEDSLCTPEFRAERSLSNKGLNKGRPAHNKGKKVTDPVHLANIRAAIDLREQKYKESGSHPRKGSSVSEDTRLKIGASVTQYAQENPDKVKARAAKAKQTLIDNGYDFGARMRGKKHKQSSIELIKVGSKETNRKKSEQSLNKMYDMISRCNLTLLSNHNNNLTLQCDKCDNQFKMTRQYFTDSKWRTDVCPTCRPESVKSQAEIGLLDYVRTLLPHTIILSGDRQTISPLELDIYIPSLNVAIEYCGLYWHSELQGKHRMYHQYKMVNCAEKGIRLITIFEDEWIHRQDLVKHRLAVMLGTHARKVPARACTIKQIDTSTARSFCEQNHIQGRGSASVAAGLYLKDELVQVITFTKPNISKGGKSQEGVWELNRMCSLPGCIVQGGANRLFSWFVKNHNPTQVITYCDLRWNTGDVYAHMGFELQHRGFPNYWYFKMPELKRLHRFGLRKTEHDDPNLTEWENRQLQGYDRIWDCGHSKWCWNNKKAE
jgi:hypothetical protein